MQKMTTPKQSAWEIFYNRYEGMEKRAVDFLSAQLGKYLLRTQGVYQIHVFPAWQEGTRPVTKNTVVLGMYQDSPLVRAYVQEDEIPAGGYFIRVTPDKDDAERFLVLITAKDARSLLWGAEAFVDEYPLRYPPCSGGMRLLDEAFDYVPTPCSWGSAPKTATRGIFTWGHPLNDYRSYIQNMARVKLNQRTTTCP